MRYRSYQSADNLILAIVAINLVLFIATLVVNGDRKLIDILGLTPAQWTAEPWTIITSVFMHANIWHILMNMLALYFLGRFLCMLVGEKWFSIIFLAGGLMGSFFCLLFSTFLNTEWITIIGASGAVFAIAGALGLLAPHVRVLLFFMIPMPLWIAIVILCVFLILVPISSVNSLLNIAWQAHLGGLITGLAAGYYLRKRGPRRIIF